MCNSIEEEKLKLAALSVKYSHIPLKTAERFGIHPTRGLIESLRRLIRQSEISPSVYLLHQLRSGNEVLKRVITLIEATKNERDSKIINVRHKIVNIIEAYNEGILKESSYTAY